MRSHNAPSFDGIDLLFVALLIGLLVGLVWISF